MRTDPGISAGAATVTALREPSLTWVSWRALRFQRWEKLFVQRCGLFPKFVLRRALAGFRLWGFLGSTMKAASGQGLEDAVGGSHGQVQELPVPGVHVSGVSGQKPVALQHLGS